jgi:hypothetical protein
MKLRLPLFILSIIGVLLLGTGTDASRNTSYFSYLPQISIDVFDDIDARDENNQPLAASDQQGLRALFQGSLFDELLQRELPIIAQVIAIIHTNINTGRCSLFSATALVLQQCLITFNGLFRKLLDSALLVYASSSLLSSFSGSFLSFGMCFPANYPRRSPVVLRC